MCSSPGRKKCRETDSSPPRRWIDFFTSCRLKRTVLCPLSLEAFSLIYPCPQSKLMLCLARIFVLILSIAYYLRKLVEPISYPFRTQRAGAGRVLKSCKLVIAQRQYIPYYSA